MEKYIESAVAQFETLLRQQLARQEKMEKGAAAKDFKNMDKIVIGVCGGDGIGPIIVKEAEHLLRGLLSEEIDSGRIEIREIEGLTIENRMELGVAVPPKP